MVKGSIKTNFIMNTILTVLSIIVPIITFPYVSRILLPQGIGKVSFATSIITYFSLVIQLGVPTYGIKAVACTRDDTDEMSKIVKSLMIINLSMCVIVYSIFLILLFNFPQLFENKLLYFVLSIILITDTLGVEWLYKGLEKYKYITVRSLFFKFIAMCCIFLFVKNETHYLRYAFFTVLASVGSNICNFVSLRKNVVNVKIKKTDILVHIRPVFLLFTMSIATTIYTNMDNIMIGIIHSDIEVGYYSTAVTLRRALLMLVTSLGTVMLPRTSYYIQHNLLNKFNELSAKAMHFVTLVALPVMIFTIIVSDIGITIYAGESFLPAASALRYIAPTILLAGWSNITGIQMLIPLNKEHMVVASVIGGAIVDFILNLLWIPSFGFCGAACATTIAEIVVLTIQLIALRKENAKRLFQQKWGIYFVCNMIPGICCVVLRNVLNIDMLLLVVLLFVIYFGVYGLLMFWKKDDIVCENIFNIYKKIREKAIKSH